MKQALIIFAKHPVPGAVKTRLTPPLDPRQAARLYDCMLHDILAKTSRIPDLQRYLYYDDAPGAAAYFAASGDGLVCLPQQGQDLGARMEHAFRQVLAAGFRSVAVIGTDSPDLPDAYLQMAYRWLQEREHGAVFGPSDDGGYYLLAMNRLHAGLFREVSWSGGNVLRKSLENAAKEGIEVELLPSWYDVDTAEDLTRPQLRDPGNGAPLTRQFLENLTCG